MTLLENCGLLVLFLFFLNCKPIEDCSKVKTGNFFYYSKASGEKVFIERHDTIQIETNTKLSLVLRSKIVWKDNCSFDLFVNSLSETKLTNLDSILSANPVRVQVLSVAPSFYICKSKIDIAAHNFHVETIDTMYFAKQNP